MDLVAQFAAVTAIERTVRGRTRKRASHQAEVRSVYAGADPDRFPHVAGAAAFLTQPDERERRDFAIRVFLDGIASSSAD